MCVCVRVCVYMRVCACVRVHALVRTHVCGVVFRILWPCPSVFRHLNKVWHARCHPDPTKSTTSQPNVKHQSKEYILEHPGSGTCKIKDIVEETTLFGCYPNVEAFGLALGANGQCVVLQGNVDPTDCVCFLICAMRSFTS